MITPGPASVSSLQGGDRSVGELFSELAQETSVLVHQEVQLATKELTAKAAYAARQAGLVVAGLLLGVVSLLSFIAALIFGLATMITLWKSALLVGVVIALSAGLLVWKGAQALRTMSLWPKQTVQSLKEDKQWLEQRAR